METIAPCERKKIYTADSRFQEALKKVSRPSQWRAKKRGWLYANYHTKPICIGNWKSIDPALLSFAIGGIIKYYFTAGTHKLSGDKTIDDLKQEVFKRAFELSGLCPKNKKEQIKWLYTVAHKVARTMLGANKFFEILGSEYF